MMLPKQELIMRIVKHDKIIETEGASLGRAKDKQSGLSQNKLRLEDKNGVSRGHAIRFLIHI